MSPDPALPGAPQEPALFSSVLIPVDLSENSRSVATLLSGLPGLRRVILLHVVYNRYLHETPAAANPSVENARVFLETMKKDLVLPGVMVTVLVREIASEEIAECIGTAASEEECTLIMMSRRGAGIISSILLGSVASDLVRYGEHSLLLIPPAPPAVFSGAGLLSRVQVCTDFSMPEISNLAFDLLPAGSTADLFHVVTSGNSGQEVQDAVAAASARLDHIRDSGGKPGITVNSCVAVGSAPEEILAYAEGQGVSLILVKSRSRKGMISSLIGSTSAPVARNAKRPVLILKKWLPLG
ncbi:MAG: Universal stress protein [Methanoregula sp. PtaU1.Bin006]|uniref:universal stress protein n=1 Tax=Methanoregula sp. PtaU1.Bin006 TaxID=1811681 RepID=UPI0009CD84D7|nr:universal stress protein [Methanoregula sp. PtaU1.Bin006]OPY32835.1 MAG: Universal stress protein [Methanoregula sp. PtaU1.Bin006]